MHTFAEKKHGSVANIDGADEQWIIQHKVKQKRIIAIKIDGNHQVGRTSSTRENIFQITQKNKTNRKFQMMSANHTTHNVHLLQHHLD